MNKDAQILGHAVNLQRGLVAVQSDIDAHHPTENNWKHQVLFETGWIEEHCEIVLGSPLSSCLEKINTVSRHEGPGPGNIHLIGDAILSISKFIGAHKQKRTS